MGDPLKQLIGKSLPARLVGSRTLLLDRLKKKLGVSGWAIYSVLRGTRDALGQTHITIEGIRSATRYKLTAAGVRYQLTRLRSAGLIRDLGWQWREVPSRVAGGLIPLEVYCREVFGGPCDKVRLLFDGSGSVTQFAWSVPEETIAFVEKPETRGGARNTQKETSSVQKLGKYRPTTEQKLAPDIKALASLEASKPKREEKIQPASAPPKSSPLAPTPSTAFGSATAALAFSSGEGSKTKPGVSYSIPADREAPPEPIYSTPIGASAPHPSLESRRAAKPASSPTLAAPKKVPHVRTAPITQASSEVLSFGGSSYSGPRVFTGQVDGTWESAGIPRYPDYATLPLLFTPNPPRLDPKLDLFAQMQRLVRYYHAACEDVLGERVSLIAKRPKVREFDEPILAKAVEALLHHHIAPAAWASFMVTRWKNLPSQERGRALFPPMRWLWAFQHIKDARWRSWFYQEQHATMGGRQVHIQARTDFDRRYTAMKRALQRANVTEQDTARIGAIVSTYFPEGNFKATVAMVWREQKAVHAAMAEQVASGGWVWRKQPCPVY